MEWEDLFLICLTIVIVAIVVGVFFGNKAVAEEDTIEKVITCEIEINLNDPYTQVEYKNCVEVEDATNVNQVIKHIPKKRRSKGIKGIEDGLKDTLDGIEDIGKSLCEDLFFSNC